MTKMDVYPAIDLRGGQVVRLSEGDYGRMNVYGRDPFEVMERFRAQGATRLHLIDLDGAKGDGPLNFPVIRSIAGRGELFVQVGGGARDEDAVARYLDAGVDRVIVGTMAVERPELLERLAAKYPGRIAVGVDARDGWVAIHGWRELTKIDAFDFMRNLPEAGIETAIYTDISKDGMLSGSNVRAYEALSGIAGLDVIASGGVSFESEITRLRALGIGGVIVGKALYEGLLDLKRIIELAEGDEST